jgi:hypothetical protein
VDVGTGMTLAMPWSHDAVRPWVLALAPRCCRHRNQEYCFRRGMRPTKGGVRALVILTALLPVRPIAAQGGRVRWVGMCCDGADTCVGC